MEFPGGLFLFRTVILLLFLTRISSQEPSVSYDPATHKGLILLNATTNGRPVQPEASFNITCRAIAKLSWYLNNAVLDLLEPHTSYYFDVIEEDLTDVIHNHSKTDQLAYQSTLLVNQASRAHEGTYQCVVYATDNVTHKTEKFVEEISITLAEILVFPGPNVPPPKNEQFPPSVTLTCRLQANVPVEAIWAFHHQYLTNYSEHHLLLQDGSWTNLTIVKPTKDDLGRYACLARRVDDTDQVHPFASLGSVYFGNTSDFQNDDLDNYDGGTNEGNYFVKNLVELAYDVEPAAATSMTCTASRTFTAVHKPKPDYPREVLLICTPPTGYVLHNEAIPVWMFKHSASDTVHMTSKDPPVRMESSYSEKDKLSTHLSTRVFDNKSFALVIRDTQFQDEGLYMVQTTFAQAESPDQKGPSQVSSVMKLEAKPSICMPPNCMPFFAMSYPVDAGDPIDLNCAVYSESVFSPTIVTWSKAGQPFVPDGDRVKLNSNTFQNGSNVLSFATTQYDDRANYSCTATNDAGTVSTETTLRVQNPKRFVGPLVALFICLLLTAVLIYAEQWWRTKHPVEPHDSSVSVAEESTVLLSKKKEHQHSLPQSIVIPMVAQGQEVYPIYVVDAAIKWRTYVERKKAIRAGMPPPVLPPGKK